MNPTTGLVLGSLLVALVACGSPDGEGESDTNDELRGNIASNQDFPSEIAVDATDVYWIVGSGSEAGVYKRDRAGATPGRKLCPSSPSGLAIAVDGTHVFWVTGAGEVMSIPKSGGTPTKIGQVDSWRVTALAFDEPTASVIVAGGALTRIPKTGGAPTTLGAGTFFSIASDGSTFFLVRQSAPSGERELVALPRAGSYPQDAKVLASGDPGMSPAVVDATHAYYATADGREVHVYKVDKTSGAKTELAPTKAFTPRTAVLAGTTLCFATFKEIACQSTGGGASVEVASGTSVQQIALGGDTLFFTEKGIDSRWWNVFDMMPSDVASTGRVHRVKVPALP